MEYSSYNVNTPQWREITVGSHLPAELRKLAEIAHNLWWTWNDDAKKLYCDLDSELWKEVEQNPVLFLERINYEKLVALAHDENFVYKMDAVYSAFKKYIGSGRYSCHCPDGYAVYYGSEPELRRGRDGI